MKEENANDDMMDLCNQTERSLQGMASCKGIQPDPRSGFQFHFASLDEEGTKLNAEDQQKYQSGVGSFKTGTIQYGK